MTRIMDKSAYASITLGLVLAGTFCACQTYTGTDVVSSDAGGSGSGGADAGSNDASGADGTPPPSLEGGSTPDAGELVLLGAVKAPAFQDQLQPSTAEAFVYTALASGKVTELHIHTYKPGGNVTLGLYTDVSGAPGVSIGSTTAFSPVVNAWSGGPIAGASVTAGRNYWIAVHAVASTVYYESTTAGGPSSEDSTVSTALPATWTNTTPGSNSPAALYASGTQ